MAALVCKRVNNANMMAPKPTAWPNSLDRKPSSLATFYTFGVLFGFIYGAVMPLYALLMRDYYPEQIVGKVYGSVFSIAAFGMGSGAFFGGLVFDGLGSYLPLFAISAAVGVTALFMVVTLPSPTPRIRMGLS